MTSCWSIFNVVQMTLWFRVFSASETSRAECVCIASVARSTFNRNNQLGNHGQDLVSTVLEHIVNALTSEEIVGVFGFTEAVEEQRQVMVIVEFLDFHLRIT